MSKSFKGFELLENYRNTNFGSSNFDSVEDDVFDDLEDIERELSEQASNYEDDDFITLSDYTGPEYGSGMVDTSIEVENRGGLRYIDINFNGDNFDVNQLEYEEIKHSIDLILEGESDESVEDAIDTIAKYGDKAVKVVFSFSNKFDLEDEVQYDDLRELMNRLCLRSLVGRDTITAVLIGANSKPHIKLAILAAGEVREKNAIPQISSKLSDRDLFKIAFDALLDIREVSSVPALLEAIRNVEDKDEEKLAFLWLRAKEFNIFGNSIIKDLVNEYNTCNHWLRPVFGEMLISFEEEIIPDLLDVISKEYDKKRLESLYRVLGKINNDVAAGYLIDSFKKGKNKKASIIGLGHIKSRESIDLLSNILKNGAETNDIIEESIQAIVFIANEMEAKHLLVPYLNSNDDRLRIHATYGLARLDVAGYLDNYIEYLTSYDVYERNCAARLISRLKREQITDICRACLTMSQDKATLVLEALTKRKVFNKEVGPILMQLLNQSNYIARSEIYKIIANTARTKNEIISADILYEAKEKSESRNERMVLTEIIERLPRKSVLPSYNK